MILPIIQLTKFVNGDIYSIPHISAEFEITGIAFE